MLKEEQEVFLDKNTIIVSETDHNGIITYANEDFCKISGYSKDELIGKKHNMIRHPDMPKIVFKGLWETIKSAKVWNGIVKNSTENGGYYWAKATVYASIYDSGIRYFSVRIKATEKEIEDAKTLYSKLS